MSMTRTVAAAAAILAGASGTAAIAQDTGADPAFETVRLSGGFTPDPYTVEVVSGGNTDASTLGAGCGGMVANAPDVRLHFTPGSLPLTISATSGSDTTLVVNAPDGRWYCNDDGGEGVNPLLQFGSPMAGRYEVWVGTYGSGGYHEATLAFSELGSTSGSSRSASSSSGSNGVDIFAEPLFASVNLSSGFANDPYTVAMRSGGANDASQLSSGCRGFVASSPDVRLTYSAGTLPLYISADSMADTTLAINAPDGNWYCDDDSGEGNNPSVTFRTPLTGDYEIYVGTYGDSETHSAELHISEMYSK